MGLTIKQKKDCRWIWSSGESWWRFDPGDRDCDGAILEVSERRGIQRRTRAKALLRPGHRVVTAFADDPGGGPSDLIYQGGRRPVTGALVEHDGVGRAARTASIYGARLQACVRAGKYDRGHTGLPVEAGRFRLDQILESRARLFHNRRHLLCLSPTTPEVTWKPCSSRRHAPSFPTT